MDRDRGDLELGLRAADVERLDVFEDVDELVALRVDLGRVAVAIGPDEVGERVPHEGVVGVGAVADAEGGGVGSGGGCGHWRSVAGGRRPRVSDIKKSQRAPRRRDAECRFWV